MEKMTQLCKLGRQEAINIISGTKRVYYRHGVWNEYSLRDTAAVVKSIQNSGYGADVFKNAQGAFYVSIPSDGDMW
jgi:hypothetical protein